MIGTIEMANKKDLELDVSAAEKIGLGLLNNHVHFLTDSECIIYQKKKNVFRVLNVGDSITRGYGLKDKK